MKKFAIVLALALLGAGCGKVQSPGAENAGLLGQPQQEQQPEVAGAPQPAPAPAASERDAPPPPASPQASESANPKVTQAVEGSGMGSRTYEFVAGQTAMGLLKASHRVETKSYSGVGEFVESIDGAKPTGKQFWAFFVNGKSSTVGASSYQLKNGDRIEWRLETIR